MLQSLKRAQRVDPENGELHLSIVKFVSTGEFASCLLLYCNLHTVSYLV